MLVMNTFHNKIKNLFDLPNKRMDSQIEPALVTSLGTEPNLLNDKKKLKEP